jgi:SAM-dependent methyltransferase
VKSWRPPPASCRCLPAASLTGKWGCGTGLLCHRYAANGHRVVGADPARSMLDVACAKPNGDAIVWVQETAETFRSDKRFDLIIMTGYAFQCLLTDRQILAGLMTMFHHLKPDGRAVFESRNPELDWDKQWDRQVSLETSDGPITCLRRMLPNTNPEQLSFVWDYAFPDGVISSESTLRFANHRTIVDLARQAGLSLMDCFGDWERGPFRRASSKEMEFVFEPSA